MPIRDLDHLDPSPLSNRPTLTPEVEEWRSLALHLLSDERAEFAWDTVSGIRDTIERTGKCSDKMAAALTNIQTSLREKSDRPRGGRRYEGYGGRWK